MQKKSGIEEITLIESMGLVVVNWRSVIGMLNAFAI
jgi:hypothetical protein